MSPDARKPFFRVWTRSNINRSVQSQERARILKNSIKVEEELNGVEKTKGLISFAVTVPVHEQTSLTRTGVLGLDDLPLL